MIQILCIFRNIFLYLPSLPFYRYRRGNKETSQKSVFILLKQLNILWFSPLFFVIINLLTRRPWWRFTNPLQVIAARRIVPRQEGVVFGIHSCTVLVAAVVRLSNIPIPAANDMFFIIMLLHRVFMATNIRRRIWCHLNFQLLLSFESNLYPWISLRPEIHFQTPSSSASVSPIQNPFW